MILNTLVLYSPANNKYLKDFEYSSAHNKSPSKLHSSKHKEVSCYKKNCGATRWFISERPSVTCGSRTKVAENRRDDNNIIC
mmetsp:Transcript_42881/g.84249  ORF Transcript_42881/g.84249 Transcript_42881/m.84249 type:complete len:82 (+) Transcript_42881:25-270(+)